MLMLVLVPRLVPRLVLRLVLRLGVPAMLHRDWRQSEAMQHHDIELQERVQLPQLLEQLQLWQPARVHQS